jgi:hypothetical protein
MCIETIKTWVEVGNDVVQMVAVAGAGLWAYHRFVQNREDETALEISYGYRSENYASNIFLVALEIGFSNRGKVRVAAKPQCNPAYSTDDELVLYSADLLIRSIPASHTPPVTLEWFPTATSKSPGPHDLEFNLLDEFTENLRTNFWLEPGETSYVGKTMVLTPGHYLAMVTFIGDRGDHEFWRRVFYICVPGSYP